MKNKSTNGGALYFTLLVLAVLWFAQPSYSKEPTPASPKAGLLHPKLVDKFYLSAQNNLYWTTDVPTYHLLKTQFLKELDSCYKLGLVKEKYHYSKLKSQGLLVDSVAWPAIDRQFTDALLAYGKDVYQGDNIMRWLKNDEVSPKFEDADNTLIISKLLFIKNTDQLAAFFASLQPTGKQYQLLRTAMQNEIGMNDHSKIEQLKSCINLYRWIDHFHFSRQIVVNIPALRLSYFENDSLKLESKVVVGKVSTRSPRFSSWCYQIVLYPYWNVPKAIGLKELLPKFKKSPAAIDKLNMQVIGANEKVIDHRSLDWSQYSRSNFPYRFRQCTGCENSLGVIKFNLSDPFDVYLHDTNYKLAFLKDTRFLSHGCIRVEKPMELANHILEGKVDSNFLKACYKDMKPIPLDLNKKVPVFVVYMPVEASGDTLIYHKDVYRLFK